MSEKVCGSCRGTERILPSPVRKRQMASGEVREYFICSPCNAAKQRRYRATRKGAQRFAEAMARTNAKYPHKRQARSKLNYALVSGQVVKPERCEHCSCRMRLDAHHPDYAFPLEVLWLCRQCHAAVHRELKALTKQAA